MLRKHDVYDQNCPTRHALDRIADKYTVLVIVFLEDRPRRFNELQRVITGVSQKMLTQTLRSLERDGLVERTIYPEVPPRVEYALTPLRGEPPRGLRLPAPVGRRLPGGNPPASYRRRLGP